MSNNKEAEQLTFDLGDYNAPLTVSVDEDWINGGYDSSSTTITLDTDLLDTGDYNGTFTINTNFEEWVDTMPSMHKIKGMCEQYPAFQKEFEKFKQMYNLIKDDYEANNEDDIPF